MECLTRRAYGHTAPAIQGELARDRFIMALSPPELRAQTQLACPRSLQEALDVARRHEVIWGEATGEKTETLPVVRAAEPCGESGDKPSWATEITELIRAISLPATRQPRETPHRRPGDRVCWGCGLPGHLVRDCHAQGNGRGSVQTGRYGP